MMLVILAAVFAVLGIALIVIPFHVAMTGICFLGLSAVCVILRLLQREKTRKDVARDFTDADRGVHADGLRRDGLY